MLRISLLGAFRVERDGVPITESQWNRRKAKSLLKLLALQPDRLLQKDQVMEALWPDLSVAAASNNLYRTLHQLRHVLEPHIGRPANSALITLSNGVVRLEADQSCWIDLHVFTNLIGQSRTAADPVPLLEAAVALYRGPLLAEDLYEEWSIARREVCQHQVVEALLTLAQRYRQRHSYDEAITALRQALGIEPVHEPAHAALIELYALAGQRHAALRQYQQCVDLLDRELGIAPSATTVEVYQQVLADEGRAVDPATERSAPPHAAGSNLPAPLTSLIGRTEEIATLYALLDDPAVRVITVSGTAGVGKTRLAIHVATQLQSLFSDGVWFVELASVRSEADVLPMLAAVLGIEPVAQQPLHDAVIRGLRGRRVLLVLDNLEQVVDAAPLLSALLTQIPTVKLLTTSRTALRVYGEYELPVPSLPLPDPELSIELEDAARSPAVVLYVERARAVQPDFSLTAANAATITEICRRLDGLPLAIELAAARTKLFSPAMILARLDRRLGLTSTGPRGLPARHQSLRAALDWSYDLLSTAQQQLFVQLSVFQGGCQLAAIERVCAVDDPAVDLLQQVAALLDNHLILRSTDGDGEHRFGMLETIHEYARERLLDPVASTTAQRHAQYYRDLAQTADATMKGPHQSAWLQRLEEEHHNLQAALSWTLNHATPEDGLSFGAALIGFWIRRNYVREGLGWLQQLLDRSTNVVAKVRADVLTGAMIFASMTGAYEQAYALAEENLALCKALNDRNGMSNVLNNLGLLAAEQSQYAQARAYFQESLVLTRAIGNTWGVAMTTNNIGTQAMFEGDLDAARTSLEESLDLFQRLEDTAGLIMCLDNLGWLGLKQHDQGRAASCFGQALLLSQTMPDNVLLARLLEGCAWLADLEQQAYRGIVLLGAAEAVRAAIGEARPPASDEQFRDIRARLRHRVDHAIFAAAWSTGQQLSRDQMIAYALDQPRATLPIRSASEHPINDEQTN